MPLSELTTESYFKTATLVRDWRDYHFCGRMFHPPLLASNWFLFCLCLNRDIYSTCCYCDILLRLILVELHKMRSDFHICVEISLRSSSWVVSNLGLERSVPTFLRINYWILVQNCKNLLGIGRSTISVRDPPEYMFKKCIVEIMSLLLYISYNVLQMVLSYFVVLSTCLTKVLLR